MQIEEALLTRQ